MCEVRMVLIVGILRCPVHSTEKAVCYCYCYSCVSVNHINIMKKMLKFCFIFLESNSERRILDQVLGTRTLSLTSLRSKLRVRVRPRTTVLCHCQCPSTLVSLSLFQFCVNLGTEFLSTKALV